MKIIREPEFAARNQLRAPGKGAGSGNLSVVASAGEKRRKGYAYGVG